MAVRGFFFDFFFLRKKKFEKFSRKNYTAYGGSETGFRQLSRWAFWWYEAKKNRDGNIFARTDFWSTLFLKMFPTSKWAKLNGFEQLTSRAFRIRSQILVAMSSFNFTAFFLKPQNCRHLRVNP